MRVRTLILTLAAGLTAAACADETDPSSPLSPAPARRAAVAVADDPYGLQELVKRLEESEPKASFVVGDDIQVRYLGRRSMVERAPKMPSGKAPRFTRSEDPKSSQIPDGSFRLFNPATLNEFEVIVPARVLTAIHQERLRGGLTSATEGVDDPAKVEGEDRGATKGLPRGPDVTTQGWSNGVDTRIRRQPTTLWPWRAITQFTYGGNGSGCSGTLVGPRHVVTAAHCIVAQGTSNWATIKVTPGRDGVGVSPYGSSTISPNPAPGTTAWYFVPSQWLNPNTANPRQWDWGLIVVPDRLGDKTGWMGYVARPFGDLNAATQYNRGYPSCNSSFVERPANCVNAALYGDTNECHLGGLAYPGPDGWNRLISASCDLSRGHSGSPMYHYFYDAAIQKVVPVVGAVIVSHTCFTCGPLDTYPNWVRRITPGDLGTISFFRQAFP